MFVKPNAFEYLLFNLDNWENLPKIEKVRASLYFLAQRGMPPRDWESVVGVVKEFERFISEGKVVRIK